MYSDSHDPACILHVDFFTCTKREAHLKTRALSLIGRARHRQTNINFVYCARIYVKAGKQGGFDSV